MSQFDFSLDPLLHSQKLFVVPEGARLLKRPGTINLMQRPAVRNPDGSVSSVRSVSFATPQGAVLVPTVVGNRVVSNAEAWAHYVKTGEHLGLFRNERDATRYADILHRQQAALQQKPHV